MMNENNIPPIQSDFEQIKKQDENGSGIGLLVSCAPH